MKDYFLHLKISATFFLHGYTRHLAPKGYVRTSAAQISPRFPLTRKGGLTIILPIQYSADPIAKF